MANIPKRVEDRLGAGLKKFQPILSVAKFRNIRHSGPKTTYAAASAAAPAQKTYTEEEKRVCSIKGDAQRGDL